MERAKIEAHHVDINGARLAYWATGAGRTLLVLHGGPGLGSSYLRAPLASLLADSCRLVFLDLRGSGESGRGEPTAPGAGSGEPDGAGTRGGMAYKSRARSDDAARHLTMRQLVADLDTFREHLGVERIDLLGHSFGGLLALHYAIAFPRRPRRIVLVDSDPASRAHWECFRDRVARRTDAADRRRMHELESDAGWMRAPALMTEWMRLRMRAYVARPAALPEDLFGFDEQTLENHRVTYPAIRADLGEWDLHGDLADIAAPTLIVAGAESIFPLQAAHAIDRQMASSRLVILDGVGHFPFLEDPERFGREVDRFLR